MTLNNLTAKPNDQQAIIEHQAAKIARLESVVVQRARDMLEWGQHKPGCNALSGTLCDCRFAIVEHNAFLTTNQGAGNAE